MESVVNIGKEHLNCGMMDMTKICTQDTKEAQQVSKIPCCSNEYTTYNIQNEFNTSTSIPSLNPNFLIALFNTFISIHPVESEVNYSLLTYTPPPLFQDLPVLNQSFLL